MDTPSDPPMLAIDTDSLEREIREWWDQRNSDWGSDSEREIVGDGGLWEQMPEIDSKAVMRTAPIFEDHLDAEFDPSLVQKGGYESIDDLINDLVPQMAEKAIDQEG